MNFFTETSWWMRLIILNVFGEEEARKFLTYVLLNTRDPNIAYRIQDGLIIFMGMGQDLMIVLIRDEPRECRDADYYALSDSLVIKCGKGAVTKDVLFGGSVLFVVENYAMLVSPEGKEFEIKGNLYESGDNSGSKNTNSG
jgi:hypothetical protein